MEPPDPFTDPHAASAALVLIDVQRDFYEADAPARIDGTLAAIPAMVRLAGAFRRSGRPIVHVVRLYLADGSNVDPVRRRAIAGGARIVAPDSRGSQIAPALLPFPDVRLDPELLLGGGRQGIGPGEHILYKPRWGAFYATPLDQHLHDRGVDTVVFAGCNYPNCPRASIYEASERDYRIVIAADAVSGIDEQGADECRRIGARVADVAAIAAWLDAPE